MLQLPQQSLLQTGIELPQPATGILNVLPETLAQAGGDLSRLAVYFVDPDNGVIEPVKMLPSPAPGQLAFEFTKPGAYAVLKGNAMNLERRAIRPITLDKMAYSFLDRGEAQSDLLVFIAFTVLAAARVETQDTFDVRRAGREQGFRKIQKLLRLVIADNDP